MHLFKYCGGIVIIVKFWEKGVRCERAVIDFTPLTVYLRCIPELILSKIF